MRGLQNSKEKINFATIKIFLLFLLASILFGCGKVNIKDIKVDETARDKMYEIESSAVASIAKRIIEQLPYATTLLVKPGDENENAGLAKLSISNLDLAYTAFLGIRAFKLLNEDFLYTHLFKAEDGKWVQNLENGSYYIEGGKNFFLKGTAFGKKDKKLFTLEEFRSDFTIRDVLFEDDTMSSGIYTIKNDKVSVIIPFYVNYNRGIVIKPSPVEDIKIELITENDITLEFDSNDFHLINALSMGVQESIYNSENYAVIGMSLRRALQSSFDGKYEPPYPKTLKYTGN